MFASRGLAATVEVPGCAVCATLRGCTGTDGVGIAEAMGACTGSAGGNGPLVLVPNGGNVPLASLAGGASGPLFTADDVKGPLFIVGDDVRGPLFTADADPFACSVSSDEVEAIDAAGFRGDVVGESNFRAGVEGVFGLIVAGRVEAGEGIFADGIDADVGRVVMLSCSAPVPVGL